jgi:hypothetical protein
MAGFNPFSGIKHAQVFEKGRYFEPGNYVLEVKKVIYKRTQRSGDAFIVEFQVLESDVESFSPGSVGSWYQNLTDTNIAFPAIKEFLMVLLGVNKNDREQWEEFNNSIEELLQEATSDSNPLGGLQIKLYAYLKKTAKGADFTVHQWTHVPAETPF